MNIDTEIEDAETLATKQAVNDAAREPLDSDDSPVTHGHDTIVLADGEPDICIQIDADESKHRYLYRMLDSASTMSHNATGTIFGADAQGLRLYALLASLESILNGRSLERLCARYGYRTKSCAKASLRKLIVTIASTDPILIEVGRVICNALEMDALAFLAPSPTRDAWEAVTHQLQRFEIRFELIAIDTPDLASLGLWAGAVLVGCAHNGPVYSPARLAVRRVAA